LTTITTIESRMTSAYTSNTIAITAGPSTGRATYSLSSVVQVTTTTPATTGH
jgi:hypothetical protein